VTAGQPLALRLALLLAAAITIVLLVAGVLVNRVVSRSLEDAIGDRERAGLSFAVAILDESIDEGGPGGRRAIQNTLRRIAADTGGTATLRDADGTTVGRAGRLPPNAPAETLTEELPGGSGTLEVRAPSRGQGFLATFNAALLVAGVLSVLVLLAVAALAADRLTRPLRGVAAAAHQLGAGDLSARAAGGSDRESRELAVAFNGMASRLERSESLRRRAASDMAHDLATPATVLESQLQAMLDGVVPTDREQLARARASATALSAVIVQLGELASAEAAPLQRRVERLDVREVAREVVAALDGIFRERSVEPRLVMSEEPAIVEADPGQLARALRNVVANAAQHSPPGASVDVQVRSDRGAAVIHVTDRGGGISEHDLPHIFERFYRADPARGTERPGSGIGLTISRELLAANGGTIEVERTGPDGTTFTVRLPAVEK
jgi:two-component system, OmpR family, sensor histidine kinase BaeS